MLRLIPYSLTIAMLLLGASVVCGDNLNVPMEARTGAGPRRHDAPLSDATSGPGGLALEGGLREAKDARGDRRDHQKRMREEFLKAIGGLPERTPLNPQVVGCISRRGYRVEKIIFESQPKHYVTALMFLPDPQRFKPPYPGVLVPCGHVTVLSKAHPEYQSMGALLALAGMAALVFDPIDQGERMQLLDAKGEAIFPEKGGHTMIGLGCIPLGRNTARFEIWDGMRAIDYLQSRPEVDPQRIGCTGNSGGGTQTSYLMALDDRIRAAAPSCCLVGLPRLLETAGAGRRAESLRPISRWPRSCRLDHDAGAVARPHLCGHEGLRGHRRRLGCLPLCEAIVHAPGVCRASRHSRKRRRAQLQPSPTRRRSTLDVAMALGKRSAHRRAAAHAADEKRISMSRQRQDDVPAGRTLRL